MAINPTKLLPPPKTGGALVKASQKMIGTQKGSTDFSSSIVKNVGIIKVKVIQVEDILKGTLAADKKKLDEKKRKESGKRREKQEEKLETKPNAEKGTIKTPKAPRLGIFDWIKNFIGNVILGYFAVRLVDHLPKIMPIVSFLGNAADFIIDVGGKLLNGLVTFIDWGYKAYDATRGFIKSMGGENFAQGFDKFIGAVDTALFLTSVLAADLAVEAMTGGDGGFGGDIIKNRLIDRGTQTAARTGVQSAGQAGGAASQAGGLGAGAVAGIVAGAGLLASALGEGAFQVRKFAVKPIQNLEKAYNEDKNPLTKLGRGIALNTVKPFYALFSTVGFLLDVVGAPFRYAIELLRYPFLSEKDKQKQAYNLAKFDARIREDLRKALNMLTLGIAFKEKGSFGNIYGNKGAQKEMAGKMAGGGITRGGKTSGGAKREIGGEKKRGKYKRELAREPSKIEIKGDKTDPNKQTGEQLDKTKYFGPILAITSKIQAKQEPTQKDYENVGLGLNLLISKGIEEGQLKGGLIAAFAEGGMVDRDFLEAAEKGSDISNWIAKTFQGEIESNAQKTLRMIREMREEKTKEIQKTTDEDLPTGTGSLVGNTNAEKVFNYLIGYGFTEQAAAGVIGNLMQESGVNPNSKQLGGGPGRGIMQWGTGAGSGGRWDALVAWATSSNKDPWKLDTQVEWMMKEMKSYGTLNRLKGVTNVKKAVEIFESEMEKAGVPNYPRRYQFAADALVSFGKGRAGGMGVDIPLGKGYGSEGSKIAGELGRYLQQNLKQGPDFQAITEHPEFGGVRGRHAPNSYHYKGRAIDIGAYAKEQPKILRAIAQFNKEKNIRPVQLLHAGNEPSGHSDHVHVAYLKGGRVRKPTFATLAEDGRPEFVFDGDTTAGLDRLAPQLLEKLNFAKTKPQLASILQSYAPYEQPSTEIEIVEVPVPVPVPIGQNSSSTSIAAIFGGAENPFESLYVGG
jgi:hypothetical protein